MRGHNSPLLYKEGERLDIPNDKGHPYRLKKFVEYQHEVPSIHYRFLSEYIVKHKLDKDDAVFLSWLMSVTYNEITCMLIFETLDWRKMKLGDVQRFWLKYKPYLDFGSARKYAKNMDWFVPLMDSFMKRVRRQPYLWLSCFKRDTPTETYTAIYKELKSINFVGRFAADLFMEMVVYLSKLRVIPMEIKEPIVLDWKHCSNLTSATYNIFYKDGLADAYDKTGAIDTTLNEAWLTERLLEIQRGIQKTYPDQDSDITMFIGKLCSFRNLFKSARYGGFHHDRQLGVILEYERILPEETSIWGDAYDLRRRLFKPHLLGEVGGWSGIRKERKKLWIQKGMTGVEVTC